MTTARLGYWQRRYLLKHYRGYTSAELGRAAGLRAEEVDAFLAAEGAIRSRRDVRTRAARREVFVPAMVTPRVVLERARFLHSRPLQGLDALALVTMFVASAVLYAATAARTVTGEDAGEFLAAAHGLGVAHPPGYPLWTLLGWLADHALPFGTAAWRITLVSALPAALANTLLLALGLKTLRSRAAAATGAGLFALSLTHWSQSVIPEVYGLNTLFLVGGVLLLVRLRESPTAPRLLALATCCGLSLTNHTSAAPVALVLALGSVLVAPALFRRPGVVLGAVAAGLLPLLLYAYLPLASARQPYLDWGNPETWDALVAHVTREQYASTEAAAQIRNSYGDYLQRLGILARSMGEQFGSPWVLALGALGFFTLLIRQTGVWLVLLVIGWSCSIGITQYTTYRFDREHVYANLIFFIPAWMTLAWLVAGGLDELLALLRTSSRGRRRPASFLAGVGLACLVALPGVRHLDRVDRSETTLVADYGRALLDLMDEGALYFPASDHSTFAVLFWQGVEGHRPDVVVADKYGGIEESVLDATLTPAQWDELDTLPRAARREFLEACLIDRWPGPVYFANRRDMTDLPHLRLEPVGPLYRIMTEPQADEWWTPREDGAPPPGLAIWDDLAHLDLDDPVEGLDFTVQMIRGDLRTMHGFALLRAGLLDEARDRWQAITADLAPLKQTFNNIGSALAEQGHPTEALAYYERALAEDPRYRLALRNAAVVHRNQGDTEAAVATLEALLEYHPRDRQARLECARLQSAHGQELEALAHYETLARHSTRDPEPWRLAGELLERIGDLTKADRAYTESLRLAPAQPLVTAALHRVRHPPPEGPPGGDLGITPAHPASPGVHGDHDPWSGIAALQAVSRGGVQPPLPDLPGVADELLPAIPVVADPLAGLPAGPTAPAPPGGSP